MSRIGPSELSRIVSHALRHAPDEYGLVLDDEGWVDVADLVAAIARKTGNEDLVVADVHEMVNGASKQRHEIRGSRIRATYGHSGSTRLKHEVASPPALLFHGTSPKAWESIQVEGLRPMGRHYVHLSTSPESAVRVGRRQSTTPLVLEVDSGAAALEGVPFYVGNDGVWLADHVPLAFIRPLVG